MKIKSLALISLSFIFITASAFAKEKPLEKKINEKKGLDVKTFIELKYLSDIQIAPNGKYGVYVVSQKSVENNTNTKNIWFFSVYGGNPKQLTQSGKQNFSPRWSNDSKTIGFISTRSDSSQVWVMDISGGEARQFTDFAGEVDDFIFSPDGKYILFTSTIYKECSDEKCIKEKGKKIEDSKLKVKVIEEDLFRHWDSWAEGKMSRLFLMDIATKNIKAISPSGLSVPPMGLGGNGDFASSPDGKEIAYTTNTDKDLSRSTNNDIFIMDVDSGKTQKISTSPSNDNSPAYSPDGKYIAYLTQMTPGFESDKIMLAIYDRNSKTNKILTEKLDRWVNGFTWGGDSKTIYFDCDDQGYREIFSVSLVDSAVKKMTIKTYNKSLATTSDGKYILMLRESYEAPAEIYRKDLQTGKVAKLSSHNDEILKNIEMGKWEEFNYKGSQGTNIHGFLVFPPFFDSKKKYPWLYVVHGGPQVPESNSFHPRWNMEMLAAPGYVVAQVNFRGSPGYGQDFINQISKDWTGKAYEDLMLGVDYLLSTQKYLHNKNFCATGASFGGAMVNWFEAKTDKFKCLIAHAGDSDEITAYGTTEEKWFPEWDIGGTPYENLDNYKNISPIYLAKNFKTPLLIIHGEKDYRVPIEQALEMYTAAKWAKIDVKMVIFPDEGHWITKPRNTEFWYNTIHEWMAKYLKK